MWFFVINNHIIYAGQFHFFSDSPGLIDTHRLRIEDRLTDLNNQPIDVSILETFPQIN